MKHIKLFESFYNVYFGKDDKGSTPFQRAKQRGKEAKSADLSSEEAARLKGLGLMPTAYHVMMDLSSFEYKTHGLSFDELEKLYDLKTEILDQGYNSEMLIITGRLANIEEFTEYYSISLTQWKQGQDGDYWACASWVDL